MLVRDTAYNKVAGRDIFSFFSVHSITCYNFRTTPLKIIIGSKIMASALRTATYWKWGIINTGVIQYCFPLLGEGGGFYVGKNTRCGTQAFHKT